MKPLAITIKRIDPALPLPGYHTAGAAAFDLYARKTTAVAPRALAKIPANLIIATPKGYVLTIAPRSSLALKKGLLFPNGFGIIDNDYCGPGDEITIPVYNFTNRRTAVKRGERIAQGLLIPITKARWREITAVKARNRGGFGSTGR
ncbi:MAG: dUTP diphosphatase [Candidatus Magasanikbacteria bacterium]|nr:dUTP diphosphatase [Candidatus Magasanikbacteria bacterium]